MDVDFLENLFSELKQYTNESQYDPESFPEISYLLMYFLRVQPAAFLEPNFRIQCLVSDRFRLSKLLDDLAASFYSNFQANCLIKNFLTAAQRLFNVRYAFLRDGSFIFDLKTTRNIVWAYQKEKITSLDLTAYCCILAECLLQNQRDYVKMAFRQQYAYSADKATILHSFEVILQFCNTELQDSAEIAQFRFMVEQLFNINAILGLRFDRDCGKEFDCCAAKAFQLFAKLNQACYQAIAEADYEFGSLLAGDFPDSNQDNADDLRTYYKQYCYRNSKLDQPTHFGVHNQIIEECFLKYQFAARTIALLIEYIDEAAEIGSQKAENSRQQLIFTPTCSTALVSSVRADHHFQRLFLHKQKQMLQRPVFTLEGRIYFEQYQAECQLAQICEQNATPRQKTDKTLFDALTVQCMLSGLFFAIQNVLAPDELKQALLLNKIMHVCYATSMFGHISTDLLFHYRGAFNITAQQPYQSDNLISLILANSTCARVRRLFSLYFLSLSYQNVLVEHQHRLLALQAFDYVKLQIPDIKVYLQSALRLLFQSCAELPVLPYLQNIVELCEYAAGGDAVMSEEDATSAIAVLWCISFSPGAGLQLLRQAKHSVSRFFARVCTAIQVDALELCSLVE